MIVQLGIYSRTFERSTLGGVLDAVVEHGFEMVHLNLRSAGLPSLPDRLRAAQCEAIHRELTTRNLQMAGLSATFNAVHPDRDRRSRETRLAQGLIAQAPELGTRFVSLSSGTRNQQDMWAGHPDNDAPSAWRDLLETMTLSWASSPNTVTSCHRRSVRAYCSTSFATRTSELSSMQRIC